MSMRLLFALVTTTLATLACSGVDVDALKTKAVAGGADVSKLRVGDNDISKSNTTGKRKAGDDKRRDEYVVKLRPGVTKLNVSQRSVVTDDRKLDQDLKSLKLDASSKVHAKGAKDADLSKYLGLDRTIHIRTKATEAQVRERLESNPDVEWVEPVINMRKASVPNDPYYSHQWHMAMLDVPKAWETTMGEGVVVAVIDTGVSVGEDGYHKVLPGWDFIDNDADATDLNQHGTHVAGTIGQAANNGVGMVGVAPKVSILPVRVLDANGSGSNTGVASGIVWAADHGANIINLSLGSSMPSETVADACAYAHGRGVTLIAATGNDGRADAEGVGYPAAFDSTIAVGSVGPSKTIAYYSNQGKRIDLVAPGGDTSIDMDGNGLGDGVLQETIDGSGGFSMQFFQGTSMATPHVAGVAALLYAQGIRDPEAIREALVSTADDLGASGFDNTYGHGLVNPVRALQQGAAVAGRGSGKKSAGGLSITGATQKKVSDTRVVLGWSTNVPATTMIKGTDGLKEKFDTQVTSHRVTVNGKKGQKVTYTVKSIAGSASDTETITVQF